MEALVGALLIFCVSGLLGWSIGRLRGRWWLTGYAISLSITDKQIAQKCRQFSRRTALRSIRAVR